MLSRILTDASRKPRRGEQAKEDKDLGLQEIHKIRNDLQLERIRMSSEIKRKERLVEEALQRLSRQHEVEISRLKTMHSAMLKKAIERGKTKEKSTITKAQNLRLEMIGYAVELVSCKKLWSLFKRYDC